MSAKSDETRSHFGAAEHTTAHRTQVVHPTIDGFTLVMTPPLPPFQSGAFGRVYRALNPEGMLVAVKVPHPGGLDAAAIERWHEECRLSLTLPPHENVVTFLGRATARWPDGRESLALVMEWLEGARPLITYADAVALDKPERVALFTRALEGASWMHEHGTPHCDLKSTNLLVIERGRRAVVKITDFGGTRGGGGSDPRPPVYSPHRAAPEVLTRDPAAIDARADVFSLGKELAELIGGADATRATDDDHENWRPRPLRHQLGLNDRMLDAVIARATQIEPTYRYADAGEMLDALRAYRPSRAERWTAGLERWFWPAGTHRRVGRVIRAAVLALVVFAVGALLLLNTMLATGIGPELKIATSAPVALDRVSILRALDDEEFLRIAERGDIDGVSRESPASRRHVWAQVIDRLVEYGAAAIALDVAFPENPDPLLNEVIGDAVARAREKGIIVVIAVTDYQPGSADGHAGDLRTASEIVRAGARWGCFRIEPVLGLGRCLLIPMSPSSEVRAPFAVTAVSAVLGDPPPARPALDRSAGALLFPGEGVLGRRIGLVAVRPRGQIQADALPGTSEEDTIGIYPISVPADAVIAPVDRPIEHLWASDEATIAGVREIIRGRVVFLAAYSARDTFTTSDGRERPGVWFHTAAAESMLAGIDAPAIRWRPVVPLLISVPLAALLSAGVLALVARRIGLMLPRSSASSEAPRVPAEVAARRWRSLVLGVALVAIAAALAWISAPRVVHFVLPYEAGMSIVGVASGALLGAVLVVVLAWIGVVRRAWRRTPTPAPIIQSRVQLASTAPLLR